MDLDEAITRALELRGTQAVYGAAPDLVTILAADASGRALPALLAMFVQAQSSNGGPAKLGLIRAQAPDTSTVVAGQLVDWFGAGHTLAAFHACEIVARRGDGSALEALQRLGEVAHEDAVVSRGALIARVALGDSAAAADWEALVGVPISGGGFDHVARILRDVSTPERYFDVMHGYVERAQAGAKEWDHAAWQVLAKLFPTPQAEVKAEWIAPPPPPADPRWFELGLRMYREHATSMLQSYVPKLLAIDHPAKLECLRELVTTAPNAPLYVRKLARAGHPLLADPDVCDQYALYEHLLPRDGGWELWARSYKRADIDAIVAALGDRAGEVTRLSFKSRALPADAFGKLAEHAGLAHFRALDLSSTGVDHKGLTALLKSPHLARLEELRFRGLKPSKSTGTALAKLPALVALHLGGDDNAKLGTKELELLLASKLAPRLRTLSLEQWQLGNDTATLISGVANGALRELRLRGSIRLIKLPELLSLAHEHQVALEAIELRDPMTSAQALDWGEVWPATLRALTIQPANDELLRSLVRAAPFRQLEALSVASTSGVTDDGLDVLDALADAALKRLDLRDNPRITGAGLRRIAASPLASQLVWLGVGGATNVRQADVDALSGQLRAAVIAAGWPG